MYNFLERKYPTNTRVFDTVIQINDEMHDILSLIKMPDKEISLHIIRWKKDIEKTIEEQSFGHMSNKIANETKLIVEMVEKLIEFRNNEFWTLDYDQTEKIVCEANLANFKAIMATELIISKDFFNNSDDEKGSNNE